MSWFLAIIGVVGATLLTISTAWLVLSVTEGAFEIIYEPFRYWSWKAYFTITIIVLVLLSCTYVTHEVICKILGV